MNKIKRFNEEYMVQSRLEQIYDDIEKAINEKLPLSYKYEDKTKVDIPINITSDKIEFSNGEIVKDFNIIGLVNEGYSKDILPKMVRLSNNSRITQSVAVAISEKLDDNEFRDFKEWLKLVKHNQTYKKRYW